LRMDAIRFAQEAPEVILQKVQDMGSRKAPSPGPWKDEQLVAQAREGEQWAIEELVGRYQQKVYTMCYHMCAEDDREAEDLTQEAFVKAFRHLGQFRGEASFYTWFYRIVVNVCLDGRRRSRRWQRLFSPWQRRGEKGGREEDAVEYPEKTDSFQVLQNKQLSRDIRRSMRSLPDKQRLVFQMKIIDGMSIREIAQVMGSAEGTVKSHLFRATRFMREALSEWSQP
jgi:RNA polymerase sigma-70 factor (ECF subfamily)